MHRKAPSVRRAFILGLVTFCAIILAGCSSSMHSVPSWQVIESNPDSTVITIAVELSPSCERLDRIEVVEYATHVKIHPLLIKEDPPTGSVCTDLLWVLEHEIQLSEPIGTRTVTGPGLAAS